MDGAWRKKMDRTVALTRRAARIIKEIEMGAPDAILANEVALCVKAMFETEPEAMKRALQQIYVCVVEGGHGSLLFWRRWVFEVGHEAHPTHSS